MVNVHGQEVGGHEVLEFAVAHDSNLWGVLSAVNARARATVCDVC